MKKVIKINEETLNKIVAKVIKEQEDEWVKVTPERYLEIMKFASYNAAGVSKLPQFRGKKIWIEGNLDVSGLPIKSLEGIGYVDGNLDISNTDIVDVSKIKVKGVTREWNSGKYKLEQKRIKARKIAESNERRESGEWDIDNPNLDDEGLYANAVIEVISDDARGDVRTAEDTKRLSDLNVHMEQLLAREKQYEEEGKDLTDLYAEIEATEDEINEINDMIDVYHLVPKTYGHYDMTLFEVVGNDEFEGREYAVGTEDDVQKSAEDAANQMIDDGLSNFNESFLENHIDEEQVLDVIREHYDYDVRENPDVYFDDDDYELTSDQENQIEEYESQIKELEERQSRLEDEIEDPEEYSRMYDDIQEQIDDLQNHIDDIVPSNEPTESMIEDKVDEFVNNARRNIIDYMKDWGMSIEDYVDKDSMVQDLIDTDGYGHLLNHYDGSYDTVNVNGEELYVMRVE